MIIAIKGLNLTRQIRYNTRGVSTCDETKILNRWFDYEVGFEIRATVVKMKGANFEKKLPCLKWRHELLSVFSWRAIISPQAEFAVCIWCAMNFSLPAWQAWQLFIFLSFNFPCHGNMELAKLISNKNISTIMDTEKCDSLWLHAF